MMLEALSRFSRMINCSTRALLTFLYKKPQHADILRCPAHIRKCVIALAINICNANNEYARFVSHFTALNERMQAYVSAVVVMR